MAPTPNQQLAGFIGKFAPRHQVLIRALRRALRRRFPTAHEMVYDNFNFFVIGYSPTERPSDAFVSLAADANGATLFFIRGATLPDPAGVLLGAGKQVRYLRCPSAAVLATPVVEALLAAAAGLLDPALPARGKGRLIIRSVSKKQRPRQAASKRK
jgi:hypothetical protein